MQRPRALHACGALRLVGGCTRRQNNVGGVTAGQAPHNSSNVGVVTTGQWDTTLVIIIMNEMQYNLKAKLLLDYGDEDEM